jgi:hypothetical protein
MRLRTHLNAAGQVMTWRSRRRDRGLTDDESVATTRGMSALGLAALEPMRKNPLTDGAPRAYAFTR